MARVVIERNPLSDFLALLLWRDNPLSLPLDPNLRLPESPAAAGGCTLPQLAAYLDLTTWDARLWQLVEHYRTPAESPLYLSHNRDTIPYRALDALVRAASPAWGRFLTFWGEQVQPKSNLVAAIWTQQERELGVLRRLEGALRLAWPFPLCRVFVNAFHSGASALPGTGCVFAAVKDPASPMHLARLLGHEGTHVLLEGRLQAHRRWRAALADAAKQGLNRRWLAANLEEVAAVAIQHRLLVECGVNSEDDIVHGRIDATLDASLEWAQTEIPSGAVLFEALYWEIQERWREYAAADNRTTIINLLLDGVGSVADALHRAGTAPEN